MGYLHHQGSPFLSLLLYILRWKTNKTAEKRQRYHIKATKKRQKQDELIRQVSVPLRKTHTQRERNYDGACFSLPAFARALPPSRTRPFQNDVRRVRRRGRCVFLLPSFSLDGGIQDFAH